MSKDQALELLNRVVKSLQLTRDEHDMLKQAVSVLSQLEEKKKEE